MPVKAGVIRAGARTTRRGAAETFTGVVFQDPVITAEAPSRMGGSVVTFTPGARTAWHAHPVGQTLFCLSGVGRICFKGEKPQVLNPGDTVNIPPDTMHWHGASPDRLFSHLALSEAGEQGQGTSWGTHVSDPSTTSPQPEAERPGLVLWLRSTDFSDLREWGDARKTRLWHGPGLLSLVSDCFSPHSPMAGQRPGRPRGHRQSRALGLGGAGRHAGGGEPDGRSRGAVDRQPAAIPRYRRLRQPRIRQPGRDFSHSRRAG